MRAKKIALGLAVSMALSSGLFGLAGLALAGADGEPLPKVAPAFDQEVSVDPVLGALRQRRLELDVREAALDLRVLELKAIEERIEERIVVLGDLAEDVKGLLVERDAEEATRLKRLARAYEAMRPDEAAGLFDNMNWPLRTAIAQQMRQVKLGPVLARMTPENAKQLTHAMMGSKATSEQGS